AAEQSALSRDRKTEAHAALFERNGWLKQIGAGLFAEARAGIVYFDRHASVGGCGNAEYMSALAGGFGGVFQKVGENTLEEILVRHRRGNLPGEAAIVGDLGVRGLEKRDALFEQPIDVERRGLYRRLGGELRERANAALESFDLIDDDLRGLRHEVEVV